MQSPPPPAPPATLSAHVSVQSLLVSLRYQPCLLQVSELGQPLSAVHAVPVVEEQTPPFVRS